MKVISFNLRFKVDMDASIEIDATADLYRTGDLSQGKFVKPFRKFKMLQYGFYIVVEGSLKLTLPYYFMANTQGHFEYELVSDGLYVDLGLSDGQARLKLPTSPKVKLMQQTTGQLSASMKLGVNRRENKLVKGVGYHLDLFICSIALILCSIFGLPWFIAATVLSITHVNALKKESHQKIPGEPDTFAGCVEQRVTGFLIFLFIGLSVFLSPLLTKIPMPCLYGVFLYMGFSSLKGVQFFDRIKLLFIPKKHHPDYVYLRHVPVMKVHLFTFIQICGLAVLWFIKSTKPISIIFPLMVAAIVGIRMVFDYFPKLFSQRELSWLDDVIPENEKSDTEDDHYENKKLESG
jgi:hypothetical protein